MASRIHSGFVQLEQESTEKYMQCKHQQEKEVELEAGLEMRLEAKHTVSGSEAKITKDPDAYGAVIRLLQMNAVSQEPYGI